MQLTDANPKANEFCVTNTVEVRVVPIFNDGNEPKLNDESRGMKNKFPDLLSLAGVRAWIPEFVSS